MGEKTNVKKAQLPPKPDKIVDRAHNMIVDLDRLINTDHVADEYSRRLARQTGINRDDIRTQSMIEHAEKFGVELYAVTDGEVHRIESDSESVRRFVRRCVSVLSRCYPFRVYEVIDHLGLMDSYRHWLRDKQAVPRLYSLLTLGLFLGYKFEWVGPTNGNYMNMKQYRTAQLNPSVPVYTKED